MYSIFNILYFRRNIRAMARELGPHNIRVNAINPTIVMTERGKLDWSDPEKAHKMISRTPLGRFAGVWHDQFLFEVDHFQSLSQIVNLIGILLLFCCRSS